MRDQKNDSHACEFRHCVMFEAGPIEVLLRLLFVSFQLDQRHRFKQFIIVLHYSLLQTPSGAIIIQKPHQSINSEALANRQNDSSTTSTLIYLRDVQNNVSKAREFPALL